MSPAIIVDLEITKVDENYRIEWNASYGVADFITAKHVHHQGHLCSRQELR